MGKCADDILKDRKNVVSIYIEAPRAYCLQRVMQRMGISSRTQQPVWSLISERIGPTLVLSLYSLLVSLLIAIPVGVMAALKPYSIWDNISSVASFVGAAAPNFFVALVLVYVFSIKLGVLPSMGMC